MNFNNLEEPLSVAVKGSSWLVTLFFVLMEGYKQRWVSLVILVLVFAALYFLKDKVDLSLELCLVVSVLVTLVVTFETKGSSVTEKFENPEETEETIEVKQPVVDIPATEEEAAHAPKPLYPKELPKEASPDDKQVKLGYRSEPFQNKKENEEEEGFETKIDMGRTFLEAYKNLTPDQIKSMTTDAKDLIETQKALVETIKSLSPVVSDGRKLLETFKDFFGPSGVPMLPSMTSK